MYRFLKSVLLTTGSALVALVLYATIIAPNVNRTDINTGLDKLQGDSDRGEYVLRASGCVACQTDIGNDGAFLAGGPSIETEFGTFYGPNITTDPIHGIGAWSVEDLHRSLTIGVTPEGHHHFPVFPYTSYTNLTDQDIVDLKTFLDGVTLVANPSVSHDLSCPFSERWLLRFWKIVFFKRQDESESNRRSADVDRGSYLINGPGHCAECHSQRNLFGGTYPDNSLGGNSRGPDGNSVPAISGPDSSIKSWDSSDITFYLQTGVKPDGDVAGGAMSDVIFESTSYLTDADLDAMVKYLLNNDK